MDQGLSFFIFQRRYWRSFISGFGYPAIYLQVKICLKY